MGEVAFPEAGRPLHIHLSLHMTSGTDPSQPPLFLGLRKIPSLPHLLLDITGCMAKGAVRLLLEDMVAPSRLLSAIIRLYQVVLGRWACLIDRRTRRHRPIITVNHPIC